MKVTYLDLAKTNVFFLFLANDKCCQERGDASTSARESDKRDTDNLRV